jgi:hypothetical protein
MWWGAKGCAPRADISNVCIWSRRPGIVCHGRLRNEPPLIGRAGVWLCYRGAACALQQRSAGVVPLTRTARSAAAASGISLCCAGRREAASQVQAAAAALRRPRPGSGGLMLAAGADKRAREPRARAALRLVPRAPPAARPGAAWPTICRPKITRGVAGRSMQHRRPSSAAPSLKSKPSMSAGPAQSMSNVLLFVGAAPGVSRVLACCIPWTRWCRRAAVPRGSKRRRARLRGSVAETGRAPERPRTRRLCAEQKARLISPYHPRAERQSARDGSSDPRPGRRRASAAISSGSAQATAQLQTEVRARGRCRCSLLDEGARRRAMPSGRGSGAQLLQARAAGPGRRRHPCTAAVPRRCGWAAPPQTDDACQIRRLWVAAEGQEVERAGEKQLLCRRRPSAVPPTLTHPPPP